MAFRPSRLIALSACALVLATGTAPAQTVKDSGKRRLLKLFAEATSAAGESTVRVQCDGKDAALGTVVSSDGYILTKGSELRGDITCHLRDGTVYDAKKVGYHRDSDLALLKIDAEGLRPVQFAKPTEVVVGNWVAVTGIGSEPVSVGVVSVGPRKLTRPDEAVIANANKGFFGVAPMSNPEDNGPAVVGEVQPTGAAAKSGIKKGDVIYEVGGKAVKDWSALLAIMENYRPNDEVVVRIHRDDDNIKMTVKLGQKSDFDRTAMQNGMGGTLSGRRTGFPAVIQHDTVIKPTDCGGPLVDLDGKVLGLNIARAGRVETWALPGTIIEPILKDLKAGKYTQVSK